MESTLAYYLGKLGLENNSAQAKLLRSIVLSGNEENEVMEEFEKFVLAQVELSSDTVSIINTALMPSYGSEYLGLGKDNFSAKAKIYKRILKKFPQEYALKFAYAECSLLNGDTAEEIFPILKEAMLADIENKFYPSSEMFELIHESDFNFEFDMLLLDKYYQPCDQESFEDWIIEFQEYYEDEEQQAYLEKLKWKGNK